MAYEDWSGSVYFQADEAVSCFSVPPILKRSEDAKRFKEFDRTLAAASSGDTGTLTGVMMRPGTTVSAAVSIPLPCYASPIVRRRGSFKVLKTFRLDATLEGDPYGDHDLVLNALLARGFEDKDKIVSVLTEYHDSTLVAVKSVSWYDYAFQKRRAGRRSARIPRLRSVATFSPSGDFIKSRCFFYSDSSDWHRCTGSETLLRGALSTERADGTGHASRCHVLYGKRDGSLRIVQGERHGLYLKKYLSAIRGDPGGIEYDENGDVSEDSLCPPDVYRWAKFASVDQSTGSISLGETIFESKEYKTNQTADVGSESLQVSSTKRVQRVGKGVGADFDGLGWDYGEDGEPTFSDDGGGSGDRVIRYLTASNGFIFYRNRDNVVYSRRKMLSRSGRLAEKTSHIGSGAGTWETPKPTGLGGSDISFFKQRSIDDMADEWYNRTTYSYDASGRCVGKATVTNHELVNEPIPTKNVSSVSMTYDSVTCVRKSVRFPDVKPGKVHLEDTANLLGFDWEYVLSPSKGRVVGRRRKALYSPKEIADSGIVVPSEAEDPFFYVVDECRRISDADDDKRYRLSTRLLYRNVLSLYEQRDSVTPDRVRSVVENSFPSVRRISGYLTSDQNAVLSAYLRSILAHFGCLKTAEEQLDYMAEMTACVCERPSLRVRQQELCDVAMWGVSGLKEAESCAEGHTFDPDLVSAAAEICSVHFDSVKTNGEDLKETKAVIDAYIDRARPVRLPDAEAIAVRVINIALARCGTSKRVVSLSDESTEGIVARTLFDACLRKIVAAQHWSWANVDAQLKTKPNVQLNPERWPLSCRLPPDCVSVVEIWSGHRAEVMEKVVPFEVNGRRVFCEIEDPWVRYVRDTPLTMWPEVALDALAWELAAELTMPLTVKPDLATALFRMSELALERAYAHDRNQQQKDMDPPSKYVRCRQ